MSVETFSRYEEILLGDFDGRKTKDLLAGIKQVEQLFCDEIAAFSGDALQAKEEAVQAAASVLTTVWQKVHNRPLS
jgi:hypothetical protein